MFEGVMVPFISLNHLLRNKRATGRSKDQADVVWLESEKAAKKRAEEP